MKKVVIAVVLLILVGIAAALLLSNKATSQKVVETVSPTPNKVQITPTSTASAAKEFTIEGKNFSFTPNTITVKKGDSVKITFKDDEGFHNLTIDGYNLATKKIMAGQAEELTFVADKTGTFAFYCAVGNHREQGMQGTLVVE